MSDALEEIRAQVDELEKKWLLQKTQQPKECCAIGEPAVPGEDEEDE